jgi:quaternary ammonium compound-resistance protein SugE
MSSTMSWLVLLVAGLFEVGWAVGLKVAQGRPWVLVATGASMAASVALLYLAMRNLPLGTSYTVWTGVGVIGTVIVGILMLGESVDATRLFCIGLILAGTLGLKLVTS